MQKQITQFKSIINEVESTFHFDANCPVETAKLALLECLKWIGQIEDYNKQILAQQEAAKAQETPPVAEEPKPVE